jgi:hypothetical protein
MSDPDPLRLEEAKLPHERFDGTMSEVVSLLIVVL